MRLPKIPLRRAVQRLPRYVAPAEGRAGKLRLDFNESTIGCSPAALRALSRMSAARVAMYPEYEATTARLAKFFRVRPAELLITSGMDNALRVLVDTFVDPGSRVLTVEPTFPMYRFFAQLSGARVIAPRYTDDLQFPLEEVLRELRSAPRIFFLANPNNPTGTLTGRSTLRRILTAARRTLVVVDEAYFEFSGATVLPWISHYPNLAVARTFSKAAGLAGLRLGCLFSCPEVIAAARRASSPFPVNAAALVAGEATIRHPRFARTYVCEVLRSREELARGLAGLGMRVFQSEANFLLVDFGRRRNRLLLSLEREGILLRRWDDFPRQGFVRVTVGTRTDTRRLIRALRKVL